MVLDDLDTGVLSHYIKIWADKWECTGEIKGGTVALNYDVFIITSNYLPADIWFEEKDKTLLQAILRRFILCELPRRGFMTWGDDDGLHDTEDVVGVLKTLVK